MFIVYAIADMLTWHSVNKFSKFWISPADRLVYSIVFLMPGITYDSNASYWFSKLVAIFAANVDVYDSYFSLAIDISYYVSALVALFFIPSYILPIMMLI